MPAIIQGSFGQGITKLKSRIKDSEQKGGFTQLCIAHKDLVEAVPTNPKDHHADHLPERLTRRHSVVHCKQAGPEFRRQRKGVNNCNLLKRWPNYKYVKKC